MRNCCAAPRNSTCPRSTTSTARTKPVTVRSFAVDLPARRPDPGPGRRRAGGRGRSRRRGGAPRLRHRAVAAPGARRARPGPAADRRTAGGAARGTGADREPGDGQTDHGRVRHRAARRDQHLPLVRAARRQTHRRVSAHRTGLARPGHPGADGRRRRRRAVELPAHAGELESRSRARRRLHGRPEAVGVLSAVRPPARPRRHRRRTAAGRPQRRHR